MQTLQQSSSSPESEKRPITSTSIPALPCFPLIKHVQSSADHISQLNPPIWFGMCDDSVTPSFLRGVTHICHRICQSRQPKVAAANVSKCKVEVLCRTETKVSLTTRVREQGFFSHPASAVGATLCAHHPWLTFDWDNSLFVHGRFSAHPTIWSRYHGPLTKENRAIAVSWCWMKVSVCSSKIHPQVLISIHK